MLNVFDEVELLDQVEHESFTEGAVPILVGGIIVVAIVVVFIPGDTPQG